MNVIITSGFIASDSVKEGQVPFTQFQVGKRETIFCEAPCEGDVVQVYDFFLKRLQLGQFGQFFCQKEGDFRLVHFCQIFVADKAKEKTYLTVICKLKKQTEEIPQGEAKYLLKNDVHYLPIKNDLEGRIFGWESGPQESLGTKKRSLDCQLVIPEEKEACVAIKICESYVLENTGIQSFCLGSNTLRTTGELVCIKMRQLQSTLIKNNWNL
jgi:hypothetical protein